MKLEFMVSKFLSFTRHITLGLALGVSVFVAAQGISQAQNVAISRTHKKHWSRHHYVVSKPGVSRPVLKPVSGAIRPVPVSGPIEHPTN